VYNLSIALSVSSIFLNFAEALSRQLIAPQTEGNILDWQILIPPREDDKPDSSSSEESVSKRNNAENPEFDEEELSVLRQNRLTELVQQDIGEKRHVALAGCLFTIIILLVELTRWSRNLDLECVENTYAFNYID
jgi:hypothetical protein